MDALVICPESSFHREVITLRERTYRIFTGRPVAPRMVSGQLADPDEDLRLGHIELLPQKFRVGTREYWILAPYGGGRDPEDVSQVIDMLIDLDPRDVQRILVR